MAGSAAWGPLSISTFRSFHWNESFSLEKVLPHSSLEPGTGCQHCRERGGGFSTLSREASLALLSGGTPAPQSCMISSETWRMHPNVLLDVGHSPCAMWYSGRRADLEAWLPSKQMLKHPWSWPHLVPCRPEAQGGSISRPYRQLQSQSHWPSQLVHPASRPAAVSLLLYSMITASVQSLFYRCSGGIRNKCFQSIIFN